MSDTKKGVSKKKVQGGVQGGQKKVTEKRVVESKSAKKVPTSKSVAVGTCMCRNRCKPEEAFWVNQGPVVETIADLKKAFTSMSEEQYQYHTSRDGSDFARWVRICIGDCPCADRLEKAKTRVSAMRALTGTCCK